MPDEDDVDGDNNDFDVAIDVLVGFNLVAVFNPKLILAAGEGDKFFVVEAAATMEPETGGGAVPAVPVLPPVPVVPVLLAVSVFSAVPVAVVELNACEKLRLFITLLESTVKVDV